MQTYLYVSLEVSLCEPYFRISLDNVREVFQVGR